MTINAFFGLFARILSNALAVALTASLIIFSTMSNAAIEEVIVSAQKRDQDVSTISASIFVLDSTTIESTGLQQAVDLTHFVPNLDIKNTIGNSNPVITIRGIGLNDFVANNDQSAGIYVDEVFLTSPAMMSGQVFDVARIEVLLGPQGTVYGKNTTAGAINFISNKPTSDQYSEIKLGVGNYKSIHAEFVTNGALTDNINGRLSATGDWSNEGYYFNRFTNNNYGSTSLWAMRGQLSWAPDTSTNVLLNLHGGHDSSDALSNWTSVGILDLAARSVCAPATAGDLTATIAQCTDRLGYQDRDGDIYAGEWDLEPRSDINQYGAVLTVERTFSNTTMTSITAYEALDRYIEEDADGSPFAVLNIESDHFLEQFSQELRFRSNSAVELSVLPGNFHWQTGVFYHIDKRKGDPSQSFNSRDFFNDRLLVSWNQRTKSAAVFTQIEWQFSNHWQLITGGRYTSEEKDFFSFSQNTVEFGGVSRITGDNVIRTNSRDNSISDSELTGSISLEYSPSGDWLSYLKYSKGFKSGGITGNFATSQEELNPYDAEKLYAWEFGIKSTLLNNQLQLNTAFFDSQYDGMQALAIPFDALIPLARLTNLESTSIRGLELSMVWQPNNRFRLDNNLGFMEHENKDPRFTGLDLPNAPKLSYSSLISYKHPLSDQLSMTSSLHLSYQDDVFKTVENNPLLISESYWLANARVSLESSSNWKLGFWIKNASNETYITEAFDQSSLGYLIYNYGLPRTYGLSVTYTHSP